MQAEHENRKTLFTAIIVSHVVIHTLLRKTLRKAMTPVDRLVTLESLLLGFR